MRVHVIGNDHGDRVDALLLVEHLAVVLVLRRLVEAREPFSAPRPVHVRERDDVLGAQRAEDARRPAAGARRRRCSSSRSGTGSRGTSARASLPKPPRGITPARSVPNRKVPSGKIRHERTSLVRDGARREAQIAPPASHPVVRTRTGSAPASCAAPDRRSPRRTPRSCGSEREATRFPAASNARFVAVPSCGLTRFIVVFRPVTIAGSAR